MNVLLRYLATLAAFVLGVCLLQCQAELPSKYGQALIGMACLMLCGYLWRQTEKRTLYLVLLAVLIGFIWADWRADLRLAERLKPAQEGLTLTVTGHVSDLPQITRFGVRFNFTPADTSHLPSQIQTQWFGPPDRVKAGEIWKLQLNFKRPHGQVNPGGFDLESWFLQQNIGATATVRSGEKQLGMATSAWLVRIRAMLRERIRQRLPNADYQGVITALTIGDSGDIPPEQWQRFANTGITHLISISGLHITMLAGLAAWIINRLWRRIPSLVARYSAQRAALLGGILTAGTYCLLAGMAVPTQRTLLMLVVATACLWRARPTATSAIWITALAVVVLIDPFAVLSVGFWLSFLTVGALLWAAGNRLAQGPLWRGWIVTQWAATLASAPILLLIFGQLPLVSPLANAFAIPIVSLLVTPLALAGLAFPPLLILAEQGFACVDAFLRQCAQWPALTLPVPPSWTLFPAACGVGLWLLPRGLPGRMLAPVFLLPLVAIRPPALAEKTFRATILDVGQGLSVLLETRRSTLLFDTGREPNGERVVLPTLRHFGHRQIDTLVLSHNDSDHVGSAESILQHMPAGQILHRIPEDSTLWQTASRSPRQHCTAGQTWQQDGVRFTFLWPKDNVLGHDDNSQSCVLRVDNGSISLLIPADIARAEELNLLADWSPTTVVIAAHHGSKSASSQEFIHATQPQWVVFSAGYRNRYHHPHPDVLNRYADSKLLRTDHDGAIELVAGEQLQVDSWRQKKRRYWHAQP